MDYSVIFARHFARLVWLLSHEPTNTDEQKAALRALATVAREGFVMLGARAGQLTANGTAVSSALSGVSELVAQLTVHGGRALEVDRNATAPDIIAMARQLVGSASIGMPAGATVRLSGGAPVATIQVTPDPDPAQPLPDFDFGEVLDDPLGAVLERPNTPRRPDPSTVATPGAPPRGDRGGLFSHFSAARSSSISTSDLLAGLDAETVPGNVIELLDALAARAEEAMGTNRPAVATQIFYRVVRRERDAQEFDVKRAYVLTVKRLMKPALLKAVVTDLARSPEEHAHAKVVLARAGEDGADALIEQLVAEEGRKARLIYFDVLVQLQAGVPTLVHMLGDARWYVARNAAAILGEMQAREAEKPLMSLLSHDDERVRHAVMVALMRLGTPRSLLTMKEALRDHAPQIRMEAAAALVGRRESNVTALLLGALDDERDDEVIASFLLALGRLGTPDAVARLIATAQPERSLFRKKAVALRVAAVQGLAEARTPQALQALTELQGDKDEDVRATAVYALGLSAPSGPSSP
jgi:HEAT repeat protein